MVRFQHTVALEPVPRRWFEELVVMLYELVQESSAEGERISLADGRVLPGIRLVKGRHRRPGAVYEIEDEESAQAFLTLHEWNRRSGVRLEQSVSQEEMSITLDGSLRGVDRPREAELRGTVEVEGKWAWLTRASGRARLDLAQWWTAAAQQSFTRSPLCIWLTHCLVRAVVRAEPRRLDGGRWAVRVTVKARGCGVIRPLAAVGLGLAHGPVRRAFAEALDEAAAVWNKTVPAATAKDVLSMRHAAIAIALGAESKQKPPLTGPDQIS
jgi:hypothetical protein